jgi:hypothetical protein
VSFQLFGIDVAQLVGDAFNGNTQDVTLRKWAAGALDPLDASKGNTLTPTDYAAQGFITERTAEGNTNNNGQQGSNQAKTGKTTILLFGALIDSAQVPAEEDDILIDGISYKIESADFDDTRAVYICTCRG